MSQQPHMVNRAATLSDHQLKALMGGKGNERDRLLFRSTLERTGLDPYAQLIYPQFRKSKEWVNGQPEWVDKMTIQIKIDGLRSVASASDLYTGQVGPFFCGPDGKWKDAWTEAEAPVAAKVGVCHKQFAQPLYAVARLQEYAQFEVAEGRNILAGLWLKMPTTMLAKCAEALALRRAFPNLFANIYLEEEMDQASNPETLSGASVDTSTGLVTPTKEAADSLATTPTHVLNWAEQCIKAAQSTGSFYEMQKRAKEKLAEYPALRDEVISRLFYLQDQVAP